MLDTPHTHTEAETGRTCSGGCSGCAFGAPPAERGGLRGWRLALASAGAFLAPVGMGIAGAASVTGGAAVKFVGAATGLVVGLVLAALVSRRAARSGRRPR